MNNKKCYDIKLEAAGTIPACEIKTPHHVPAAVYIQEADFLYHWAQNDIKELVAVGVPEELIDDLPIRIGALIHAEAILRTGGGTHHKIKRGRDERLLFAENVRKRLLWDFRFAFRKHPPLLRVVREIEKSNSKAGTVQDLNDLSVLGNLNRELLETIHFDMSLLETAAQTSVEMARIVAETRCLKQKPGNAKIIRDRIYTHLKEAVDEIRQAGQYVFRHNKERLTGYRSGFIRKLNRKRRIRNPGVRSQNPVVSIQNPGVRIQEKGGERKSSIQNPGVRIRKKAAFFRQQATISLYSAGDKATTARGPTRVGGRLGHHVGGRLGHHVARG